MRESYPMKTGLELLSATSALIAVIGTSAFTQELPKSATPLAGTAWSAVEVDGTTIPRSSSTSDRDPHLAFGEDGRVSGADGCNRLTGSYMTKDNAIAFGAMASTQMACAAGSETARRFREALQATSHWSLVKERLEFYGSTGKPLIVFERRPARS
jgi:heat shock protein HslJ